MHDSTSNIEVITHQCDIMPRMVLSQCKVHRARRLIQTTTRCICSFSDVEPTTEVMTARTQQQKRFELDQVHGTMYRAAYV